MMVMMYSFHPPIVHNFSFFDGLASHRSMSSCSKTDPSSSKTDPFSSKTDPFSSKMAFVKTHVSLDIFSLKERDRVPPQQQIDRMTMRSIITQRARTTECCVAATM